MDANKAEPQAILVRIEYLVRNLSYCRKVLTDIHEIAQKFSKDDNMETESMEHILQYATYSELNNNYYIVSYGFQTTHFNDQDTITKCEWKKTINKFKEEVFKSKALSLTFQAYSIQIKSTNISQKWYGDIIRWETYLKKKPDRLQLDLLQPIEPSYLDVILFRIQYQQDVTLYIMAYELTDSKILFLLQQCILKKQAIQIILDRTSLNLFDVIKEPEGGVTFSLKEQSSLKAVGFLFLLAMQKRMEDEYTEEEKLLELIQIYLYYDSDFYGIMHLKELFQGDTAFLGTANFTFRGLNSNVESSQLSIDSSQVLKNIDLFERIKNGKNSIKVCYDQMEKAPEMHQAFEKSRFISENFLQQKNISPSNSIHSDEQN